MPFCNVIIYSYHYLLDPKIAERVSKELSKDCIVVFDEAHNIDNVCIESLSTDITEDSLRKATRGAQNLETKISEMKDTDAEKLQNEYAKLVEGLREADEAREEDTFMSNPGGYSSQSTLLELLCLLLPIALPDDLLKEAVPGNIRRAEHFVAFLKRFVEYLKVVMRQHLVCYLDANPRASVDADESSTSHFRNTFVLLGTFEGNHIHREKTPSLLRGAFDLARSNARIDEHRRLSATTTSCHVRYTSCNI